ncbi:MAG: glycerophosphodiester phosphodiesterase [Oligoflexales bacterium]
MRTINLAKAAIINFAGLISFLNCAQLIAQNSVQSSCVAHRGYSAKYLENSIEAILAAEAAQAPGIEFDVVHTKDGIPIIHHDETPQRTARSKKGRTCKLDTPFADQNFSQLKENCELQNGEDIPSLAEVFAIMQNKNATLFVELKDTPSQKTLELLKGNSENKVVISDSAKYLDKVAITHNAIPLILISKYPVPLPERFDGIGTKTLSDEQLMDLHLQGKLANIWTVNDRAAIRTLVKQGIDYITTDELELCMEET